MISFDRAADALDVYDALLERAHTIVSGAPYWAVVEMEWSRLEWDGDESSDARLAWPEAEYDSSCLKRGTVTFPSRLLFISDTELAAWKKEQRAAYDKKTKDAALARQQEIEAQERSMLAALKSKYERKP